MEKSEMCNHKKSMKNEELLGKSWTNESQGGRVWAYNQRGEEVSDEWWMSKGYLRGRGTGIMFSNK